ncbi:pathogen-inducible salicylic acid glucosyltransferase [Vigna unguiculata]|uniref:Pathogen-inducible salicylic acid glucosyltransferase n=1 Tax=Vigna unguiculata TaxID=3917 RepID=A0A4D6KMD1_VIGUN|nr:pathogen-inducible salicylic acid glucosyltransferase [Vigna unguiculata]
MDGSDVPLLNGKNRKILQLALKSCEWLPKAQYLLLPSIYELESKVVDALKANLKIPIYTIGPSIPYSSVAENSRNPNPNINDGYMEWLDKQPPNSVLYISHGSYLSISSAQMEEIANALHDGNVRFMWVTREESPKLREICGEKKKMGLVVAWCDQLRVLLHRAVGGYWSHCGWNSVMEGIFCGVPFLTFPIAMDQPLISRLIVEYWKVGWRVKKDEKMEGLVRRDVIVELLRKFMDLQSDDGREMRRRAKELQLMVQLAIAENGSSHTNIRAFLNNIVQSEEERVQVQKDG